jgi:hypothetical protein
MLCRSVSRPRYGRNHPALRGALVVVQHSQGNFSAHPTLTVSETEIPGATALLAPLFVDNIAVGGCRIEAFIERAAAAVAYAVRCRRTTRTQLLETLSPGPCRTA